MTFEIVVTNPVSTDLAAVNVARAGAAANRAASQHVFADYQQRRPPNTLRRQCADLDLFATFLGGVGAIPASDLATSPESWRGITWGLVAAFVRWQLQQGYAIGSINVRLSTVKTYAKMAFQAGQLDQAEFASIKAVEGFRYAEGRNIDQGREVTRVGHKKAEPTSISTAHALLLKDQAHPRDQLLMCILLDHGLRCGEVTGLRTDSIDLRAGTLTFYREKVGKTQTHRLTADTLRAAMKYLKDIQSGPLFPGWKQIDINRRVGELGKALELESLSPHDCRHFWATAATRGGTDIKSLQDAGGWSSPAMPLRYVESAAIANDGVKLA